MAGVAQLAAKAMAAPFAVMDLGTSAVRDVLAGENPFDQYMTPWSFDNRATGRDILRNWNAAGDKDTWGNFAAGMALDAAVDPLTYVGGGLLKAGAGAAAARAMRPMGNVASKLFRRAQNVRGLSPPAPPRALGVPADVGLDLADPQRIRDAGKQLLRVKQSLPEHRFYRPLPSPDPPADAKHLIYGPSGEIDIAAMQARDLAAMSGEVAEGAVTPLRAMEIANAPTREFVYWAGDEVRKKNQSALKRGEPLEIVSQEGDSALVRRADNKLSFVRLSDLASGPGEAMTRLSR